MKLQHELKRPQPFASPQQEVLAGLLRIGDQLDNRLSRFFRDRGLTLSRFNVLRILDLAQRPLTCGEIGERMIQIVPAITSLVDHLEHRGLVQRQRCDSDRRVVHVCLTAAGKELVADAVQPLAAMENQLFHRLSPCQLTQLIELLDSVRQSLSACDGVPATQPGD